MFIFTVSFKSAQVEIYFVQNTQKIYSKQLPVSFNSENDTEQYR